ncbi:phosphatidylserine decarboxylase-domain-containing protein [Naematelia encephala]|uniref:Phosphatidylserine decarboxylase proenzyme 1, mitochondrial n=1 Tax=Naematelia encephala TaxID=71784 RepID=A0A1Y2BLS2_9TREE|nr:phosphatidylserine decarboxylase-domain-containing protein [Naematelia encephala]
MMIQSRGSSALKSSMLRSHNTLHTTLLPARKIQLSKSSLLTLSSIRYNSSIPPRQPPPPPPSSDKKSSTSDPESPASSDSLRKTATKAWSTPTKWYPIPLALGALVLLAVQWRKQTRGELEVESQNQEGAVVRSKKVDGPWQVRVLGALPLRSLSQLWGYLNGLVLPVWFRPFGFRLYARIFGCNLDECVPEDLTQYESLGEFFYRELKAGARPIAEADMVSPADGRVLHFGEIAGERVEQVKGLTYSLQALLGSEGGAVGETSQVASSRSSESNTSVQDRHFADINDIHYSLGSLLGSDSKSHLVKDPKLEQQQQNQQQQRSTSSSSITTTSKDKETETETDASHTQTDLAHDASVAYQLGARAATSTATEKGGEGLTKLNAGNKLYFLVVYLAPGDYHRFHSPTSWVVERRRHFTGDLFSVSPYIANRLKDLFVLNERIALLGRWKYGFFSMVPVGATNVGSIRINFDESLRTNTRHLSHPPHTFTEAVYSSASSILRGQPLLAGEEMGGFRLGSTIVLVFEAPGNWRFTCKAGEKIKVGEKVGELVKDA